MDKSVQLMDALSASLWERCEAMVCRNREFYRRRYQAIGFEQPTDVELAEKLYDDTCNKLANKLEALLDEEYATQGDVADLRSEVRGLQDP